MSHRPAVRDDLVALSRYHSPQLQVSVRLNTNESPEGPPDGFCRVMAERVRELDWNRYPDRSAFELRSRLAELHDVSVDNIIAANGSNEILQALLLAWGGHGRKALTFEPTYTMHGQIARVTGTAVVEVDRGPHYEIDLDRGVTALEEHRPVITFLCSPNNPTGLAESRFLVEAILETVGDFGLVVLDEAYVEFSDWSGLELLGEEVPLVITRTFSKTWALAGARIGYMIGPTWVVEQLWAALLPYHLDALSQLAGRTAIDFVAEMRSRVDRLVELRGQIQSGLADLGLHYWPSQSNFVLFRPPNDSGQLVWAELVKAGVLVRDCSSWPRLRGCLRVTVGSWEENQAFLDALALIVERPDEHSV